MTPEQLEALWKRVIRSDVPPPDKTLLSYFVAVVHEIESGKNSKLKDAISEA